MDDNIKGSIKFEEQMWVPTSYEFSSQEQAQYIIEQIKNNPNIRNIRIINDNN